MLIKSVNSVFIVTDFSTKCRCPFLRIKEFLIDVDKLSIALSLTGVNKSIILP